MKRSKTMLLAIILSLLTGCSVFAGADGGTITPVYSESELPGGGVKFEHNKRIHLSTNNLWVENSGHLSDLIRLQWTGPRAKPAIAFVNEAGKDKTAIVSHDLANDPSQPPHRHISIETTMSPGGKYPDQLFTRFEIPYDQDTAEIRTHSSNFNVMDGIFRVAGSSGVDRDLQLAKASAGNVIAPRWTLRADSTPEQGGNSGSNFKIIRYSDTGSAIDAPLTVERETGNVTVNSLRISESKTPASSSTPCLKGEITYDNKYIYICTQNNLWSRANLETW